MVVINYYIILVFYIVRCSAFHKIYSIDFPSARLYAMSVMELGTTLMVPSYDTWHNFGEPRIPRSLSSVILDEGVIENILKDIHDFVDDQSWYLERGT